MEKEGREPVLLRDWESLHEDVGIKSTLKGREKQMEAIFQAKGAVGLNFQKRVSQGIVCKICD